jgi:hypothetical protein
MPPPATTTRGRWLLWIALAAVVLTGAAWAALAIVLPPARVQALVERQLARGLAREARFEGASVGLFPVRITVRQPALAEPGGFARGAALAARSIHLDLDLLALLGRHVVVRRLALDRPQVHLVLRPDGTTNFDGLLRPPAAEPAGAAGSRPGMDLELAEIAIAGGRVLVDDLARARRTAFGVDSRLGVEIRRAGRIDTAGETTLSAFAFGPLAATRLRDLDRSLAALELEIGHRGGFDTASRRLGLERLDLALGEAKLSLTGVVDEPGPNARLDLRARGSRIDLRDLFAHLAAADAKALQGLQGRGRLDLDLAVRGRLGPERLPDLIGTVRMVGGALRYPQAPGWIEGLVFAAALRPDSLLIPDFRGRIVASTLQGPSPFRGSLSLVRFKDPLVAFTFNGILDLGAVAPLVAPRNTRLGGRAEVALRGGGPVKDPGALLLEGRTRLSGVSVESPDLPNRIEKVRGEIRLSRAEASVRGLSLAAGKSSLLLDGTLTRPLALLAPVGKVEPAGASFSLRSSYLDLAELLPVTPGAPVLPNARGQGTVAIARLRHQRLDVERVSAQVELAPHQLVVPAYSLLGYGGAVTGRARFDLRDPATPAFSAWADVDTVSADALLSAWTPARGWLNGTLGCEMDLSGQGGAPEDLKRTLTAIGTALVANGTLGPGPALEEVARTLGVSALRQVRFEDLKLPFRVERGRVITDPVTIEGPEGRWLLSGGIGFDGTLDYAVSVTLPPEAVARLRARSALAVGALADEQGNLLIDLRVTGPAKAPRVRLDGPAMRDRLAGRASQAIAEQRARLEAEAHRAVEARRAAAEDSARRAAARARQALEDSLRRRARNLLEGFFARDTAAP